MRFVPQNPASKHDNFSTDFLQINSFWHDLNNQVAKLLRQEAHQLVGQAKRCATKIQPKAFWGDIFDHFSNFDIYWLEVADDIATSVALE